MATNKNRRLSNILHAEASNEMAELDNLQAGELLSVEDQLRIMKVRYQMPDAREDVRFPDVWVKGDGTVVAVKDMSLDHMCMTIGLWLRKEFETEEARNLGIIRFPDGVSRVSAYDTPEAWLTRSQSFAATPSLSTMLARLRELEGGMAHLHELLQERAAEALRAAQMISEHSLFDRPAFF